MNGRYGEFEQRRCIFNNNRLRWRQNPHFTEGLLSPHCSRFNYSTDCIKANVFTGIFGFVNVRLPQQIFMNNIDKLTHKGRK